MSEAIYNRIAMLRAERGIARRKLADALGLHSAAVSTGPGHAGGSLAWSNAGGPLTQRGASATASSSSSSPASPALSGPAAFAA